MFNISPTTFDYTLLSIEGALQMGDFEELIGLKYSVDKEESESLERAAENEVKRGSGRTKEWIGKERRRMNQLISGTISLDTLRCWCGELSRCGCVLNAMMLNFEQQPQQQHVGRAGIHVYRAG